MKYQMPMLIAVVVITILYACGRRGVMQKKHCVQAVTVLLTIFSGFRSWWMGDLIKYYTLYLNCNGPDWKNYVFDDANNIGLRLFFRIAGAVHISYDICILLIAALVAICLGVLIFRYSPSPYWSYLMYIAMGFYLFTYSGLKQSIAMSFLIIAAICYFEGRQIKMIIWVFVAALFHVPALIFLLLLLLPSRKIGVQYFVTIVVLFTICFLFKGQLVSLLSNWYYDEQDTYENINALGGRFIMMCFIMIIALILRPLNAWDKVYSRVFSMMIMAALCQMFSVYDNNFSRLADYFFQFVVLFIPLMLESGTQQAKAFPAYKVKIRYWDRSVYILATVCITAFSAWYYNSYLSASTAILDDFKFFWQIDPYSLYGK